MDYFVSGRLKLDNENHVGMLLEAQKELKSITFKSGQTRRHHFEGLQSDEFVITARTYSQAETVKVFDELKDIMIKGNISGFVSWHGCNHENDGLPCEHDDYFANGMGVF